MRSASRFSLFAAGWLSLALTSRGADLSNIVTVADTKFSHDRGFYETNFSLLITCATPGVTIRYTLDGKAPTTNSGTIYSGPILITNTTVVRALAYKTGLLPSDVDSQTYLYINTV